MSGMGTFTLATGSPLLSGGLAYLDCQVISKLDCGTSTIFVGEVVATQSVKEGNPLLYFNRGYRKLP